MVDLKTQLSNLVNLQTIDAEIYALKREKEAKPEAVKVIEASFETKKADLQKLEKTLLDLQKQKKDQEGELAAKEEGIKKLQTQLFQLKTNKEYHAMQQQIADAKADCSVIEDKILQVMDQLDKMKTDIEKEKQKLASEEKVFAAEKATVQARIKEIDERLETLQGQRTQIIPSVDPKIFAQYERILQNKEGLAIVTVKNNSCQGCNMHVPPQVVNLVMMYEHIVVCEMCNRILYIENEAV